MFLFFFIFSFVISLFFFVYCSFHCKKLHKQQLLHQQQLLEQLQQQQQLLEQQLLEQQQQQEEEQNSQIEPPLLNRSLPIDKTDPINENDPTHFSHPLLLAVLLSDSTKRAGSLTCGNQPGNDTVQPGSVREKDRVEPIDKTDPITENDPTRFSHSLLLEILLSASTKRAGLLTGGNQPRNDTVQPDSVRETNRIEPGGEDHKKKKKKRGKKKSLDSNSKGEEEKKKKGKPSSVGPGSQFGPWPFTSTSSATQRKIKKQYDQFVKYKENEELEALAKVGEFSICLNAARNDLEHKSEVFKRKSTITKALLTKADRSSFDRLSQQMRKLELEQKRLEEDGRVYNWMYEQLIRSPAYKKMLVIGGCLEAKAQAGELTEDEDVEEYEEEISFEELLEQEKKDSFWQKNGKIKFGSS